MVWIERNISESKFPRSVSGRRAVKAADGVADFYGSAGHNCARRVDNAARDRTRVCARLRIARTDNVGTKKNSRENGRYKPLIRSRHGVLLGLNKSVK